MQNTNTITEVNLVLNHCRVTNGVVDSRMELDLKLYKCDDGNRIRFEFDFVDGAAALIRTMDALVRGSTIGGSSGSRWEVDGDSALNWIIAAL
ncbi:hypothetical protein Tco_0230891 [Tanacetum coccineum]